MTLNIGVIGTGMIGQDHIRRLTSAVTGTRVVALTDADGGRARTVADRLPGTVTVHETGQTLIEDPAVDAVVVTSWGTTHEEYVLAGIAAGKQVFCEKPLATTVEACERIVKAEVAAGRRLVMVGFVRRFDVQYEAMKKIVTGGDIGRALMMHAAHRNASVPDHYTSDMIINDTVVHDIDLARWMFDDEIESVTVRRPRRNRNAPPSLAHDPVFVLLEMRDGVLVDVEAAVTVRYGYDIRGEVVGENGTVELSESAGPLVKVDGRWSGRLPTDWRERFVDAFDAEFQAWADAVSAGTTTGPSAWDGYAATVACEAGLEALRTGQQVPIRMTDRPDLYA